MQTHQRKGSIASWLAGAALLLFAALALPGTQASTRAQEAPAPADKQTVQLLTAEDRKMWTSFLRGDPAGAYTNATKKLQAALANDNGREVLDLLQGNNGEALLAFQREAALELPSSSNYANELAPWLEKPISLASRFRLNYAQELQRSGRATSVEVAEAPLNFIKSWRICGPFSNERGEGFETRQPPEDELSLDKVYVGKNGQECRFVPVPVSPRLGVIDLGSLVRPNIEASAFLVALVRGPLRGWLRLASDGPVKAWIRTPKKSLSLGASTFETNTQREFGFDQDSRYVDASKGWVLLVLKVAVDEGNWRLRARFDLDGSTNQALQQPRDDQEFRTAFEDATADANAQASFVKMKLPINGTFSGRFWSIVKELFEPRLDKSSVTTRQQIADLIDETNPSSEVDSAGTSERAILTFLLAEASKSSSRVASGKEENKRRELLEQVLKLDPKAARAALELAKYYSGTFRNPTEADRYAKMAVQLAPKWVEARVFAARVATMKGLDGEVERELAALLKEYPDHPSVLRFAGYYRGVRGDYRGSDELFKRCLYKGDFTDSYCRERLFSRAVERNDTDAALQYANETRQLNPFDLASSEGLIQLFLATGFLERAMAECERALSICPREDKFLARKGEIYMRMAAREPANAADFKAKAIAAYRESLKCNPNNEDLARYLEFLADEKPVWEVKLQENIEARIEAALKLPVDGNDPYRVVYRDEITVVNDDGTKSIYFQYAYRICNDDGREVLQELGAPAYSDQVGRCVGARVYRRDGGTEEGRRVESTAMLPPLDIGDIVAVRYRVSDTAQSFFGDFFGASEALDDFVPVDEVRLVYVLPKSRKFFEYVQHGAAPALKREEGDKAIWTFTAKGLARVPREGMQLPLEQMVPTVQVSTYENWKDFGRWYYNLIKKQLEPTPEMRAKVASLIEGRATERDKARAIYNWVVTNIRYNADWHFGVHGYKPFSAGAIFERCIGDCKDKAIVICTMLGIAGVKAYPVLIRLADSSDPRGREDITLPMPHHFNHAIAYIEYADGKGQFVDGTATFNGFDELPGSDAGANVVIVRPEGGVQTVVPIPPAMQNCTRENGVLEFLGNGKVKLTITLTANGDRASYLRAIYLQPGTRATQLESQWARHKPGAKVIKVEANDLANIDLPPEIKYEVELPDAYTTDAQGNIELAVALNPLLFGKGLAAATTRRTDIAQGAPHQWQSVLTFKAPAGMELEKFPASYVDDAFGSTYWVSVEQIDREYHISRTYSSGGGVIDAKDYGKLREMMLAYDRAEAAKLKLVKEK